MNIKRIAVVAGVAVTLVSCKGKSAEKGFEVSGKITNNPAKMIYLEKMEMASERGFVVDSAEVGKNGMFSLSTEASEACIYNLRIDRSNYPFAAVINDEKKVTVDVTFNKANKEFPEKYEVRGSEASGQMQQFMFAFNGKLQAIYIKDRLIDSLQKSGGWDSTINLLQQKRI